MDEISALQIALTIFGSMGFWNLITEIIKSKTKKKSVEQRLLLGIAHDRIHYLCNQYKKRGCMTEDEIDTLESIVKPYLEMGGNGSGARLYNDCMKLPISTGG